MTTVVLRDIVLAGLLMLWTDILLAVTHAQNEMVLFVILVGFRSVEDMSRLMTKPTK